MAKKKISKKDAEKQIKDFFTKIKNKSLNEVKKIKRLAMAYNLRIGKKRKKFCKKCLSPYTIESKIRINNGIKSITCEKCNKVARWKI